MPLEKTPGDIEENRQYYPIDSFAEDVAQEFADNKDFFGYDLKKVVDEKNPFKKAFLNEIQAHYEAYFQAEYSSGDKKPSIIIKVVGNEIVFVYSKMITKYKKGQAHSSRPKVLKKVSLSIAPDSLAYKALMWGQEHKKMERELAAEISGGVDADQEPDQEVAPPPAAEPELDQASDQEVAPSPANELVMEEGHLEVVISSGYAAASAFIKKINSLMLNFIDVDRTLSSDNPKLDVVLDFAKGFELVEGSYPEINAIKAIDYIPGEEFSIDFVGEVTHDIREQFSPDKFNEELFEAFVFTKDQQGQSTVSEKNPLRASTASAQRTSNVPAYSEVVSTSPEAIGKFWNSVLKRRKNKNFMQLFEAWEKRQSKFHDLRKAGVGLNDVNNNKYERFLRLASIYLKRIENLDGNMRFEVDFRGNEKAEKFIGAGHMLPPTVGTIRVWKNGKILFDNAERKIAANGKIGYWTTDKGKGSRTGYAFVHTGYVIEALSGKGTSVGSVDIAESSDEVSDTKVDKKEVFDKVDYKVVEIPAEASPTGQRAKIFVPTGPKELINKTLELYTFFHGDHKKEFEKRLATFGIESKAKKMWKAGVNAIIVVPESDQSVSANNRWKNYTTGNLNKLIDKSLTQVQKLQARKEAVPVNLHVVFFSGGHRVVRSFNKSEKYKVSSLISLDGTYTVDPIVDAVEKGAKLYMVTGGPGRTVRNAAIIEDRLTNNDIKFVHVPYGKGHYTPAKKYLLDFMSMAAGVKKPEVVADTGQPGGQDEIQAGGLVEKQKQKVDVAGSHPDFPFKKAPLLTK